MILLDWSKTLHQLEKITPHQQQWINSTELNNMLDKIESLLRHDIVDGEVDYCWGDCCGCADCGHHTYTYPLDDRTVLNIGWNNWRGYQNGIEIRAYNEDKKYWDTIFHAYNCLDVTSWKHFYLDEFDRKFLMHVNLMAIMRIKSWKTGKCNDPDQSKLEDYL